MHGVFQTAAHTGKGQSHGFLDTAADLSGHLSHHLFQGGSDLLFQCSGDGAHVGSHGTLQISSKGVSDLFLQISGVQHTHDAAHEQILRLFCSQIIEEMGACLSGIRQIVCQGIFLIPCRQISRQFLQLLRQHLDGFIDFQVLFCPGIQDLPGIIRLKIFHQILVKGFRIGIALFFYINPVPLHDFPKESLKLFGGHGDIAVFQQDILQIFTENGTAVLGF